MVTKRALFGALCCCLVLAGSLGASYATAIRDVRLYADCDGYTVYAVGENFEEGESLVVDYSFLLNYLGPDPLGEDVSVSGSLTLTCEPFQADPGKTTCTVRESLSETWAEALGSDLACGQYQLDSTSGGGVCGSIPTRWVWTDIFGGQQCNRLPATGFEDPDNDVYPDWNGFLDCPCDPEEPGVEICRTPGFWGTHAGTEKKNSTNITQAVLDAANGIVSVCGETVDTTALDTAGSALEGMCVAPRGDIRLQLARQLTAAALNCVMTNGEGDCADVSIEETFQACDLACANGWDDEFGACIDAIDCFNNGGIMLDSGMCQIGTCGGDGITACDGDERCGYDDAGEKIACVPLEGNCHDRALVNEELGLDFDPPGAAGSSKSCNTANRNGCTLFGGCKN